MRGGVNLELLNRISGIERTVEGIQKTLSDLKNSRADKEKYGLVKISDATSVTEIEGLALPSREKNASIDGTLANEIGKVKVNSRLHTMNVQIPESLLMFEGRVQIPDDIVHTYICCVPQEVFPLDSWNAAYPRLNITEGGTNVLVTVSGPRAGNFRISFYFLYYQNH